MGTFCTKKKITIYTNEGTGQEINIIYIDYSQISSVISHLLKWKESFLDGRSKEDVIYYKH